ncbi:hypothetical protein BH18ACT17_BH18ACT17_08270 [soil metagenome]
MQPRSDLRLEAAIHAVGAWRGRHVGITPISVDLDERHFLIEVDGELFVLRMSDVRHGNDLAAEVEVARAAAAAGVAPEVLEFLPQLGCLVTRFAEGHRLTPGGAEDSPVLASVVGSVRALHACPLPSTERSVFREAEELRRTAIAHDLAMPRSERGATAAMRRIEQAGAARGHPVVTCHGNLTGSSLFLDEDHVWIVDLRWAGAGDPFEDLGSIATHLELTDEGCDSMLALYFGAATDDRRSDLVRARAAADYLRAMRDLTRAGGTPDMNAASRRFVSVAEASLRADVV